MGDETLDGMPVKRYVIDGDVVVQIDLTGINSNTPVTLPGACDKPISL